jgi:hypothetical protein
MITEEIRYYSNTNGNIVIGDTTYPLQRFDMPMGTRNNPVGKMQVPGEWPTYAYPANRKFFLFGDILGNDASDYNTKVKALRLVVQPPYKIYSSRRHGYLRLKFFGDGTYYYSNVILEQIDTPKEANYPAVGTYEITFHSFDPFLRNVSPDINSFTTAI